MTDKVDTTFRRVPERGGNELEIAQAILDAAKICHVGITLDSQPYVLPMACARDEDRLLLHGSVASRLINSLDDGLPVCATATHLDGLVFARSAFHSSMNYRSVMVFGTAVAVTDPEVKAAGLDRLVEHLFPGRLQDVRSSRPKELNATTLLSLPIETFTTKVRTGPPSDPAYDLQEPVWAGVVPLTVVAGEPMDAPDLEGDFKPPGYLDLL